MCHHLFKFCQSRLISWLVDLPLILTKSGISHNNYLVEEHVTSRSLSNNTNIYATTVTLATDSS